MGRAAILMMISVSLMNSTTMNSTFSACLSNAVADRSAVDLTTTSEAQMKMLGRKQNETKEGCGPGRVVCGEVTGLGGRSLVCSTRCVFAVIEDYGRHTPATEKTSSSALSPRLCHQAL